MGEQLMIKQVYNCSPPAGDDDTTTVLCDATKQLLIHHPPKILLLQLKRFNYFSYRSSRKNNTHITFPPLLDLAPYCSEAYQVSIYIFESMKIMLFKKN